MRQTVEDNKYINSDYQLNFSANRHSASIQVREIQRTLLRGAHELTPPQASTRGVCCFDDKRDNFSTLIKKISS